MNFKESTFPMGKEIFFTISCSSKILYIRGSNPPSRADLSSGLELHKWFREIDWKDMNIMCQGRLSAVDVLN